MRDSPTSFITGGDRNLGNSAPGDWALASRFQQLGMQPGTSVIPMPISRCNGNIERGRSLLNAHTSEVSQLHEVGCRRVFLRQFLEGIVNGQELIGRGVDREIN